MTGRVFHRDAVLRQRSSVEVERLALACALEGLAARARRAVESGDEIELGRALAEADRIHQQLRGFS